MNIPSEIRAGDTVKWRDDATVDTFGNAIESDVWTLKYYLRANVNREAHTATGTIYLSGWEFTITAAESAEFEPGEWYWQAVATRSGPSETITLGYGQLIVEADLSYVSNPGAFDGRSQVKKDLDAVQLAIRTLIAGGAVQEYKIGNRNLKRYDLQDLIQLEGKLKAEVKREEAASLIANGLGNPRNMFVRFN